MNKKTLIIGGSVLAAALVFGGVGAGIGAAVAESDGVDNDDAVTTSQPAVQENTSTPGPTAAGAPTQAEIDSATRAALEATTDGTVTEVERSNDLDHAWEVEVTFADGHDVEVQLDADFALVRIDD